MFQLNTKDMNMTSVFMFYTENGIISLDDIMNSQNKEELMIKILKEIHKSAITPGNAEGKRWSTYVPDTTRPNGRRQVRFKEKEDLYKFLLDFYHIKGDGTKKLFSEVFTEWVEYKKGFISTSNSKKSISPSTIRRYERDYGNYLADLELADMTVDSVTTPKLMNMLAEMIKKHRLMESCASNVIGYVKGAFHYAYLCEYISKDPADRIDRDLLLAQCEFAAVKQDSERILTISEIKKLIEAIKKHSAVHPLYMPDFAILIATMTGLRVGELSTLKWTDIDYENGLIHIVRSEHRLDYSDKKSEIVIGLPKNRKTRTIPLNEEIIEVLEIIKKKELPSPEGYIFTKEDGSRYTGHDIGCAASRRAQEAGIGGTSIHEIRRTVSSLLNTELPRRVVAELMGHTERVNAGNYDYSTAEYAEKKQALKNVYSKVLNFSEISPKTKKTGTA